MVVTHVNACGCKIMNIAFLRKKYSFHGGSERYLHSLASHMAHTGHEVHIYASQWAGGPQMEGLRVHRVRCWTVNSFVRDLSFAVFSWLALRRSRHDIVQTHAKTFVQDIYRGGDGCHIEWLRQRWRRCGPLVRLSILGNPHNWLNLWLERRILRGHHYVRILAISDMVKRDMVRNYGVSPDDVDVVYNGVDTKLFSPANREGPGGEVRRRHEIAEGERVALFVGSGFERKGVRPLLEAVRRVRGPLVMLIVGRGKPVALSDMPKDKRIIFCGAQPDVVGYYAAADVFVFPTMYEPFGNVHLEALASGIPVVTTRLAGGAELIEQGRNGFVVDVPEDAEAIARAIETLTESTHRGEIRSRARATAERFSFDRHIESAMAVYERVICERKLR
jgi:UDP-glucose:(heptosyl)LPS alpha-1,3-glucosyltransferase